MRSVRSNGLLVLLHPRLDKRILCHCHDTPWSADPCRLCKHVISPDGGGVHQDGLGPGDALHAPELPQVERERGGAKPHKVVSPVQDQEVKQSLLLRVQLCSSKSDLSDGWDREQESMGAQLQ